MGWKLCLPTDVIDGPEFSVREPSLNDFSLGQFSFPGENHPLSDWERGWGMRWTRQNRGCECWGKPLCFCSYLFVFGLAQICSGLTPASVLRVTPGSSQRTKCSSRDRIWVNSMLVKCFKLCTICPGQSAAFSWCFSFLRVHLLFSRSGLFCALPLMITPPPFLRVTSITTFHQIPSVGLTVIPTKPSAFLALTSHALWPPAFHLLWTLWSFNSLVTCLCFLMLVSKFPIYDHLASLFFPPFPFVVVVVISESHILVGEPGTHQGFLRMQGTVFQGIEECKFGAFPLPISLGPCGLPLERERKWVKLQSTKLNGKLYWFLPWHTDTL